MGFVRVLTSLRIPPIPGIGVHLKKIINLNWRDGCVGLGCFYRQPRAVVEGQIFRAETQRSPAGNPGTLFRSEVPDDASASENIVLAALARIHIELRHARPEVSAFAAQAEVPKDLYIEPEPSLEYARAGSVRASEGHGRAL